MADALLSRLDRAVGALLEKNHQLAEECRQLRAERTAWQQEKADLLNEIGQILRRLDGLNLEEL